MTTLNYVAAMRALARDQLAQALTFFSEEAVDSPCYGLALANKALVELRLEQFSISETSAHLALAQFDKKGCPHPPTWVQTIRHLGDAISRQDRPIESIAIFDDGCRVADMLAVDFPDFAKDCLLEKAHACNSCGGSALKSHGPEAAIDCFIVARDIYRNYPDNSIGPGETLTNLAQAYTVAGKKTEAAFAIAEAKQFAKGDENQLHRINIAAARLGLFTKEESRRLLLDAASAAEREGSIEKAYVRHCIAAFLAYEHKDCVWGEEVLRLAIALECHIDQKSLQPPRLRFYKAGLLEHSNQPAREVLSALLEGARMWCDRLPGNLGIGDYREAVGGMHDHFRKLSGMLLREGRHREAFVAFEAGRARAFAMETSANHDHPFLAPNPFGESEVDCALLNRIQLALLDGQLVISLAVLASNLAAFIVDRKTLQVFTVGLSSEISDANAFGDAVQAIAAGLALGKSAACIPHQITALVQLIVGPIGDRSIVLLAPHALLHKVPWRILLRQAGIPWAQLPFVTQFSPFLNPDLPNPDAVLSGGAVALGHGFAGVGSQALNLEDEAKEFAEAFGRQSQLVLQAGPEDVSRALHGTKTVFISCHGNLVSTDWGDKFLLCLADGGHEPEDLIHDGVAAPLIILSACSSGVYEMALGDYPVGAAPTFLLAGAKFCICTRFPISAHFAKAFFPTLGRLLGGGHSLGRAFATSLLEMEAHGQDIWRHLACVELLGRGISDPKFDHDHFLP